MSLPSLPRSTRWTNRGKNGVGENQGLQWNPGLPHAGGGDLGQIPLLGVPCSPVCKLDYTYAYLISDCEV